MKSGCPSTDELRQLLGGLPAGTQSEKWSQHLDQCECCQAKLEELATGGTNLSQLVERLHELEPVAQSAYWPAIRAVGQAAAFAPTIAPPSSPRPRDST